MPSKHVFLDEDPLTRAMAPPRNESAEDRQARLREEATAKRISDEIDEELNRQRLAERKASKPVKILLLGQSESGKSTTLKNFQLMNSPKAFHAERASWKAVIQLNIVRSVRIILDAMSDAQAAARPTSPRENTPARHAPEYPPLTAEHLKLKMRLAPLIQVEDVLMRKISGGAPQEQRGDDYSDREHFATREPAVHSGAAWKHTFTRLINNRQGHEQSDVEAAEDDPATTVLNACGEDCMRLWADPTIKQLLIAHKMRLQEMAGFFLDALDRVTKIDYVPTDDDILRARIKTLGVTEYRFTMQADMMPQGNTLSHDWRIFDVGGHRSLVPAWAPFFDDMNAIIFLAPISCFDQVLAEDPTVNRLEDSVLLWKSIVSNPLLMKTNIVLFLNKCDILKEKLDSGMRLADYIVSYGNRPNDFESASNYLKKKFGSIYKEQSRQPRPFYYHLTSVTNTKTTVLVLQNVQDIVLRRNLQEVQLIA
ncbi:hypothetical protein PLICRDRAFT_696280 [Plicaturopsis crispa FD-325 SS-3]|nr:hypothetical protein PLICRDRAFT_696280 [Plicaturopsis crispa FD-325 SS-3]